ncbi:MAG: exodeoxyribonuclease VII small subunit [Ruminococcaceae bacterium]|nr:exodeoxyribonuclease VII small subunit [Oscillospiraceae bacterium]
MMKKEELSFEEAIKRLEKIASELEGDKLSLEDSLKLYEEGIRLIRYCNTMLEGAERKIKMIGINADGEPEEKDFLGEV